MKPRSLLAVAPLVVALGLAACDGRDYEAEVTALSEELSATRAELDAAMNENEQLHTELERMRADAPTDGAGGPAVGVDETSASTLGKAVEGELEAMTEKLTVALASLSEVEVKTQNGELSEVRENLQEAVGSARTLLTVVGGQEPAPGTAGGPDEAPPEVMRDDEDPARQ